jgi:hypothetical protein
MGRIRTSEDRQQKDAAPAQRLVRCSVCGVPMPAPPNPDGNGVCLFDTCQACIEAHRRTTDAARSSPERRDGAERCFR